MEFEFKFTKITGESGGTSEPVEIDDNLIDAADKAGKRNEFIIAEVTAYIECVLMQDQAN